MFRAHDIQEIHNRFPAFREFRRLLVAEEIAVVKQEPQAKFTARVHLPMVVGVGEKEAFDLWRGERPALVHGSHDLDIAGRQAKAWRIIHRVDENAMIILEVFGKQTNQTPKQVIQVCKRRLRDYAAWGQGDSNG